LHALVPALDFTQDELIIIDNGSVDDTCAMVHRDFPQIIYHALPRNIGIGPARNRGIALSSGKFLMTLDNDTLMPPNILLGDIIAEEFKLHPEFGLFGFKLLNLDGTRQQSARRFPHFLNPIAARIPGAYLLKSFRRMHANHLMEDVDFENVTDMLDVDYVLGANQVFRREVLADTHAYDPWIFYGPEDYEFCLRLWRNGWRVGWSTKISIRHEHRRITRKLSKLTLKFFLAHLYVFAKYRSLAR
jgi:GT2 family glycosyltransferase